VAVAPAAPRPSAAPPNASPLLEQVSSLPALAGWRTVLALPASRRGSDVFDALGLGGRSSERVLALAWRPSATEGVAWRAALHVLKKEDDSLALSASVKLRSIRRLEGGAADGDGRARELVVVSDAPLGRRSDAFVCADEASRQLLLGALYHLAVEAAEADAAAAGQATAALPQLGGVAASEARVWANAAARALDLPTRGGAESGTPRGEPAEAGELASPPPPPPRLLSFEEAAQVSAMLESYRLGVADVAALEERLRKEASELEASTVHSLLESDAELGGVLRLLDGAQGQLAELRDWLGIFQVKLLTMRGDIRAIESRSNRLERQARNNAAVAEPLAALLAALELPAGLERLAAADPGSDPRAALRGGQQLAAALEGLQSGLPQGTEGMAAVAEVRAALGRLRAGWCARVSAHVRARTAAAFEAAAETARGRGVVAFDPGPLFAALRGLQPLAQQLVALDETAALALREAHCVAGGEAVRRGLRELASAARAAAKEAAAGGDGGLPPADGFARLLEQALRLLLAQAGFAAEAHGRAGDGGERADLEALLAPAGGELEAAAAWAIKADPPAAVAALGALGRAPAALAAAQPPPAAAAASILRRLLGEVAAATRRLWLKYLDERAAALARGGEDREGGGGAFSALFHASAARTDVLPEVARLTPLLARIGEYAAATEAEAPRRKPRRGEAAAAAPPPPPDDGRVEAAAAAHERLLPALCAAIERAAGQAAGHAGTEKERERRAEVRLRNYVALRGALAGGVSGEHARAALAAAEEALESYSDELASRAGFAVPLELLSRMEAALEAGMEGEAVAVQAGLARSEVRRALRDALGARKAERGVAEAFGRCARHFPAGPGKGGGAMQAEVWAAVRARLLQRYGRLEELVLELYGDALQPATAELAEAFKMVGAS